MAEKILDWKQLQDGKLSAQAPGLKISTSPKEEGRVLVKVKTDIADFKFTTTSADLKELCHRLLNEGQSFISKKLMSLDDWAIEFKI